MSLDRDIDKVLTKTDAAITDAGYKELEIMQETADDVVVYEDSVEFDVSQSDYETGIPEGLREMPVE